MTNPTGDLGINFSERHLAPEERELSRWQTMARYSTVMTTAKSAEERMAYVEAILDKFRDVPNQQPGQQDTAAYARFAAKTFLEALTKSEGRQEAAAAENMFSVANENVFNEWIDEWLPSPDAAPLTRSRM